MEIADRLKAAGVEVEGPVDKGFVKSIFFKDPNHLHIELSAPAPDQDEQFAREKSRAKSVLADWTKKTAAKKEALRKASAA